MSALAASLGTFGEDEARAIADELAARAGIAATVKQLSVVGGEPTCWWHVCVPAKDMTIACAWLSGWRAGRDRVR